MSDFRSWLRSPVLHFILLGGLVFTAERLLVPASTVGAAAEQVVAELPSVDELLLRDAFAIGLDRTDALVRDRLVRLGESVVTDDVNDRTVLESEARRLGLDRSDPVIRRRLVQAMTLALSRVDPSEWPAEQELRAYYERNRNRYALPARYVFEHVYFARDRDDPPARSAADQALAVLQGDGTLSASAQVHGDAFLLGTALRMSQIEVAHRFGPEFSAALETAPIGQWTGPVSSPFGLHLVWISERSPADIAAFESVRGRVVHDLLAEREAEQLRRRVDSRRESYGR